MQDNVRAAREISQARTAAYSSTLWAEISVTDGPHGACGHRPCCHLRPRGSFLGSQKWRGRFQPPDFDTIAVEVLAAWFLDYGFFRFSLEQVLVGQLFGRDPVAVTPEMAGRLSVAGAQFLCGYEKQDVEKRISVVPFAALTIKESMWGGPLPEEWIP
jgi:hypothetical protein